MDVETIKEEAPFLVHHVLTNTTSVLETHQGKNAMGDTFKCQSLPPLKNTLFSLLCLNNCVLILSLKYLPHLGTVTQLIANNQKG